jgi:outer membrane biosynthesis protein TonB
MRAAKLSFMVRPRAELGSLRFSRLEKERLIIALLFSLFLHLGVWGGYEVGKKNGWWEKWRWPFKHKQVLLPKPVVQVVDPAVFVDVSEASADAPKEAKYYSDKNSRAANPEADKDSNQPKLTGKQRDIPKTQDVPRPVKAKPETPTPPQPQPKTEPKPAETKTASAQNPGAFEKAKPADTLHPDPQPPTPERPRTLKEARAQQPDLIAGQQMQQDGGVRHRNFSSSLDALSTSFGGYDRAVIQAISQQWYDLLDQQRFALDRTGKVTIYFHLNPDGSITEAKIVSNEVGDVFGLICLASIQQAAPFGKWPSDMRRKFGAFREITFTFIYY